ncbi:MAG: Rieske (2Fe-2S) protein [Spirochaetaceae bacterium]|nr:Rieske (2Fe-2S) protein [Spirochaetaceae bacterium]
MGTSNGTKGSNGMVPVASLDEVRRRGVVVTQAGDRSVAVFADGAQIHAVDNRCPHMGFPLDRGSVKDGILTCHWHEARFELASGCTFDLWADDAISYPTEVRGGEVWVATRPRSARDAAYHRLRLRRGMEMGVGLVQAKSLISLLGGNGGLMPIVASVVDYAAANVTSFGEGMVRLTCVARLAPWLSDETLYLGMSYAVRQLADEANAGTARRPRDPLAAPAPNAALKGWLRQWVLTRHRDAVERTLLAGVANGMPAAELADLLYGAAADRLYANTGHLFDACNKALELTDLLDGAAPDDLLALLAPALADARGEEENTPWHHPVEIAAAVRAAEERLPELLANGVRAPTGTAPTGTSTATAARTGDESAIGGAPGAAAATTPADGAPDRRGAGAMDIPHGPAAAATDTGAAGAGAGAGAGARGLLGEAAEDALVERVLGDDPLDVLAAVEEALAGGAAPAAVGAAITRAAGLRLARFATSNEVSDWFNPQHTLIFCNAVQRALLRTGGPDVVRALYQAAIAVYMDRYLNVPAAKLPAERGTASPAADDAAAAGLLDGLLAALDNRAEVERAADLTGSYLRTPAADWPAHLGRLVDRLAYATLREDLDFHTLQVLEAAATQLAARGNDRGAEQIMVGVVRNLAAHCPTQRAGYQTAVIARRLQHGEELFADDA